jgi:hypothetical protein
MAAALPPAVAAALTGGSRSWRFRYELVDRTSLDVLGELEVEAGKVAYSDLADVQRTGDFTIRDTSGVNFATDRLRPVASLRVGGAWVDFPLGVFMLAAPTSVYGIAPRKSAQQVTGYDEGLVLRDDKVLDRYTVAAGANYLEEVGKLLESAGLDSSRLTADPRVLPAAREWDPGTAKFVIVNALLAAINYRSLFFDASGAPVAQPYASPSEAAPLWTYAFDELSVTLPGVAETLDLTSVPNVWVRVVSQPDTDPLRAQYVNDSPTSPTSTVRAGRTIVDYAEDSQAADQATLTAKVKAAAEAASQVYASTEFDTLLMPIHSAGDVLLLDVGNGVERYRETEWSLTLQAGSSMHHKARKVVNV